MKRMMKKRRTSMKSEEVHRIEETNLTRTICCMESYITK